MLDNTTPGPVSDLTLRAFFGFTLAASLLAAANLATMTMTANPGWRQALVVCYLLVGLGSGLALRLPRERAQQAMLPLVLTGLVFEREVLEEVPVASSAGALARCVA